MSKFEIKSYQVGQIGTNCYLMCNLDTKEMLIIDPGDEADVLKVKINETGCTPKAILLTHGHFDHILAMNDLKNFYGVSIYAHEKEREMLQDTKSNMLSQMGITEPFEADIYMHGDAKLQLAGFAIQVFLTPGHTPGGCCYYFAAEKVLFSGDTLFNGSVGRTDFPGGSMSALIRSVEEKLFVLPEDVTVYPGHEGPTNIGREKKFNPYF